MNKTNLKPTYSQIAELLNLFDQYLEALHRAASTRREYMRAINHWIPFPEDPLLPSTHAVLPWAKWRRKQVAVSTFNVELTVIRTWYRWLHQWRFTNADYSTVFPRSHRAPKRLPRSLEIEDFNRLLNAAVQHT